MEIGVGCLHVGLMGRTPAYTITRNDFEATNVPMRQIDDQSFLSASTGSTRAAREAG